MNRIGRTALVVRPAQLCLDWINCRRLQDEPALLPKDVVQDGTVYLVPEGVFLEEAQDHLKHHAREIFERELFEWHEDSKAWPKPRDWNTFQKWFTIEVHSAVVDLDGGEFETEES